MSRNTPRVQSRLVVTVTDGRGRATSAHGLGRWLARAAPLRARGMVAIGLVSDREMRGLNRTFLGHDRPTDVLSFPAERLGLASAVGGGRQGLTRDHKSLEINHLGDISIARGVASRQARAHGHSLATELRVLALHGLLHLLGYDHERDKGEMRRLERRLRQRAALPVGLIDRSTTRTRAR